MNRQGKTKNLWIQDIPFWVLLIFIIISLFLEIANQRYDLLASLIPIGIGAAIYAIRRWAIRAE